MFFFCQQADFFYVMFFIELNEYELIPWLFQPHALTVRIFIGYDFYLRKYAAFVKIITGIRTMALFLGVLPYAFQKPQGDKLTNSTDEVESP